MERALFGIASVALLSLSAWGACSAAVKEGALTSSAMGPGGAGGSSSSPSSAMGPGGAGGSSSSPSSTANVGGFSPTVGSGGEGGGSATAFYLFVAQTPPYSLPIDQWKGVTRLDFQKNEVAPINGNGIPASDLADPAGLAFRVESAELFIGNRHGNMAADGTQGSVSRFFYDAKSKSIVANGKITGNGLDSVHQVSFNPKTGELFAANANYTSSTFLVSRFKFDAKGNAIPNGGIGTGSARGVAASPDGKRLYVTEASATIRQFDLTSNTELAAITAPGSPNLHFMAVRGNSLFVPGVDADTVFRYAIDGNGDIALTEQISATKPVAVTFSPDGLELFVSGHNSTHTITCLSYDAGKQQWKPIAPIAIMDPGALVTVAEDAVPTPL